MNNLIKFEKEELGQIRGFEQNGEVWFIGKDVAISLGYSNARDALKKHVDDEDKGVAKCDTLGGSQEMTIINESGLYSLIFGSTLPKAKEFKHWVTSEVLPSIRKNGAYALNPINEFKGQMATLINEMFEEKMSDAKEYYKIKSKTKSDISSYIKKRLGILRADGEYEQVKERVFMILGISKWEDLNIDGYRDILPVIDESIRVIKMDRPEQLNLWD